MDIEARTFKRKKEEIYDLCGAIGDFLRSDEGKEAVSKYEAQNIDSCDEIGGFFQTGEGKRAFLKYTTHNKDFLMSDVARHVEPAYYRLPSEARRKYGTNKRVILKSSSKHYQMPSKYDNDGDFLRIPLEVIISNHQIPVEALRKRLRRHLDNLGGEHLLDVEALRWFCKNGGSFSGMSQYAAEELMKVVEEFDLLQ